jgi:7-cyano-7-deazaguanine synthase
MACLKYYRERGHQVSSLFVDYGQPSSAQERAAAAAVSREMRVQFAVTRVCGVQVPAGKIPGRNALLLTVALMRFEGDCGLISIGIHAGTDYEDCSPIFVERMQAIFDLYSDGSVRIDAPFLRWTKRDIFDFAISAGLPVKLTYSCELGSERPCGRCTSCRDIEALNAR